jgi:purine-binding chemotaxis protein CheW
MSGDNKSHRGVVDQKDALSVYFDALLREEAQVEPELRPHAEPEPVIAPLVTPPVIAVPTIPEVAPETKTETETVTEQQSPEQTEVALEMQAAAPVPPLPEGVPEWAASPFQALLFKVSGLTLAVPLAELSGVQEWEDGAVTPMLGKIEWYLGLMEYRGRQVPVVDTAQLVLPPDRLEKLVTDDMERLGHVVFIQDGTWGLACDSVDEVISLDHEEVKWRSSRSKRRWLAGTVLEHMCAIIDPPAFAEMLRTGMADVPEEMEQPQPGTQTD